MVRRLTAALATCAVLTLASLASAADIVGSAADPSGVTLPGAQVVLHNVATGAEDTIAADQDGRFRFSGLAIGIYRLTVSLDGFSKDSRTVAVGAPADTLELTFVLRPGGLSDSVTVTATRSERDALEVPIRTDTITAAQIIERSPSSTGEALLQAPGITAVGSGPFAMRPRLRGLDSTRLLVLVDGERLNNARTATDRAGTEVGLIDPFNIESLEVVSGAGSVLYGTDALAGTINIITNQPKFSDTLRVTYGFDGYYSSNEDGRRGTAHVGLGTRRFTAQVVGTIEEHGNYKAGRFSVEDTRPYFASGQLDQADVIDDNFGFRFNAFPDPFNAPYVRTDRTIANSSAQGDTLNVSGMFAISNTQTVSVKYLRRRVEDVGFADFSQPTFFQSVSLPTNNFDRLSARYEARAITPWFTNLKVSAYYQDQQRLLRNEFPVVFPAPTATTFFPISVFRLDILSDTEQRVKTPGIDVQGTFLVARTHVITAGTTVYADRSADVRTTTTQMRMLGNVSLGARGPQATVFPAAIAMGAPTVTHPSRVPDASFRDVGVFVQDEYNLTPRVRLVAGVRLDRYTVTTKATPAYEIESLIAGATPAIDPSTLPDLGGSQLGRTALTGDIGVVFRANDTVSLLARYGRSYRHANLEELLFSGSATVGYIIPNMSVKPETGNNIDLGLKVRSPRYAASLAYFNNAYDGFISTEIVSQATAGPLSRAINFSDVRIQGVEADGELPLRFSRGLVTLFGNVAFTRGDVLRGSNPLTGDSLDNTPFDNISPLKSTLGVRLSDARDRFWVEYGARLQKKVERVAPTLIDSPYLIAQDLLSLDGFAIQRLAIGADLTPLGNRLGVVVAVENLGDTYYREQFQFAPARGRTVTLALRVRN